MSDTMDGVMMLGAYVEPMRKLYCIMAITLVSMIVAVLIGGIEALGLIGVFALASALSWFIYRLT